MTEAYPLHWPAHRRRTPLGARVASRFDISQAAAQKAILDEISRAGGQYPVISTNVELRRDGLPYANRRSPEDTGVAVYFRRKGVQVCFACDKYLSIWENMRAIGKTLEAMRGIERWGAEEMLDQAFSGFTALPPPEAMTTPQSRDWWVVLGIDSRASEDDVQAAWKSAMRKANDSQRLEINLARDAGMRAASLQ